MALYLRGKTWWMRFTAPDGAPVRESTKTSNHKLAQEVEANKRHALFLAAKMGVAPDRPFAEAVKHFLGRKELEGLRTVDSYEQQLEWWQEQFDGVTLQKIDEAKIATAIHKKAATKTHQGERPTPATLNRYLSALRACLKVAHRAGWIVRAPVFEEYKEPKNRIRWLTADEKVRLLNAAPDWMQPLIRMSLATGLRQANVLWMEWGWIDEAQRKLTIPGTHFKNGNEFCIPLSDEAMRVVLEQKGKHGFFVFSRSGEPIRQMKHEEWSAVLDSAGITNFRWHDLRHTWATDMVRTGMPLHVLQKLGGWETLSMVMKYAHHDVESLRSFITSTPQHKIGHSEVRSNLRLVS